MEYSNDIRDEKERHDINLLLELTKEIEVECDIKDIAHIRRIGILSGEMLGDVTKPRALLIKLENGKKGRNNEKAAKFKKCESNIPENWGLS